MISSAAALKALMSYGPTIYSVGTDLWDKFKSPKESTPEESFNTLHEITVAQHEAILELEDKLQNSYEVIARLNRRQNLMIFWLAALTLGTLLIRFV